MHDDLMSTLPETSAASHAAAGDALYAGGRFAAAVGRFREAVRLKPDEGVFHYKLACAAWKCDQMEAAERHLLEAVRLLPRYADAHDALAQWRLENGDFEQALHHSAIAAELAPADQGVLGARASVLAAAGQVDAAWKVVEPLIAKGAAHPRLILSYALMAPRLGHEAKAVELLDRALQSQRLPAGGRRRLHFVAANLLDRMERYDGAFSHARQANALVSPPHDPIANARRVDRLIEYFTPQRLQSLPRATQRDSRPIFIVGMPRSGTSLVEQILASHPQVFGAGELMTLGDIAWNMPKSKWAHGRPFPECLDLLSQAEADALAAQYLAFINGLSPTSSHVTDKMPGNHWHLGLIQRLLPNSRVIHCIRDPLDTCLSCHLTDFSLGNRFTANLRHLGAYHRDYRRLMDHWRRVASMPALEVRYEEMVGDVEQQTRRLLEFIGLDWDDRCLKFFENKRRVTTASKDQVRRPIYASSIGRWKRYERHLSELMDALNQPE